MFYELIICYMAFIQLSDKCAGARSGLQYFSSIQWILVKYRKVKLDVVTNLFHCSLLSGVWRKAKPPGKVGEFKADE